jgi:peptidoglycan/LPS O-acetylase OafA/YrhL
MAAQNNPHIAALDGIRGLAILQVLIWHYSHWWQPKLGSFPSYILRSLSLTWSGVDLFFVLSGFLIGGILLDNRASSNYFGVFYIRRFCRIVPIYILLLLLGWFLKGLGVIDQQRNGELISPFWYLTFTQNFWMAFHSSWDFWLGQTWSLAVEEQFYLLLPLTIWLVSPRKLPIGLIMAIVAALLLRSIAWLTISPTRAWIINHVSLATRMDALALGVLSAYAVRDKIINKWLREHLWLLYVCFAGLIGVTGIIIVRGWGLGTPFMVTVGFTFLATLYACLLLIAVLEQRGPVKSVLNASPLRHLGIWAYCLYLIHALIPYYVFRIFGRDTRLGGIFDLALFAVALAIVLVTAHLSWRYFEKPLLTFGHKWKYILEVPSRHRFEPQPIMASEPGFLGGSGSRKS